ncbi:MULTISPECIES: hypothetical protein [unclassified Streptomyces]|uniref:hypothetical protein n=1 Tax=unclassified Streptomyces TaxID=2593676 RepID=UPI0004C24717|nr:MULTISPECIES: hypothetical protein [unclassified Streptomyces]
MIQQVTHTVTGTDPAGTALALAVASALHAPSTRAPEVVPVPPQPQLMGLRTTAAHPHRRRVALRRLDTLRA